MAYWNELSPKKLRHHRLPVAELQLFASTTITATKAAASRRRKSSAVNLQATLWPYMKAYCDNSSIHCMHYLSNAEIRRSQKAVWLLLIVLTSVAATYVYFELAELYATKRIQTTILDSVHPIFYVSFPSIGICPRNTADWAKLNTAHLQRLMPPNASAEAVDTLRRLLVSLEDLRFDKLAQLRPLFEATAGSAEAAAADIDHSGAAPVLPLHLLDGVDLGRAMEAVTPRCGDIFAPSHCLWRRRAYNCCELFTLERTEAGFCHVFNSMIGAQAQRRAKADAFYPHHNAKAGDSTGLEVLLRLNASRLRPGAAVLKGVYVMVKQPEQWHNAVRFIGDRTYTKIAITAQQTETEERTRVVGPEVRRCLFEDERAHPLYKKIPGLLYWRGNCLTRCHQEYLVQRCGCSTALLFPRASADARRDNFTECRATQLRCLYEHAAIFGAERQESESRYVDDHDDPAMVCNCLNSCNQLLYTPSFTSTPLEGYDDEDGVHHILLDVHYQATYMLKYNTHVRFTFTELLANFGGVIGLFLGASLLSAVEVGYYLLAALWGLYTHRHDGALQRHRRPSRHKRVLPHQQHWPGHWRH